MDEQTIDPLRTDPKAGEGAQDIFTQDNTREPTSVPLVGGNGRAASGTGSDIDGPDLGGPEFDEPDEDMPELDVPDEDVPELDVPDEDVPELGEPDLVGSGIGGTGRDGLSGGIASDGDLPGSDGVLPGEELDEDITLDRPTTAPTG